MSPTPAPAYAAEAVRALHELVLQPEARYEELLAVPADYALRALGADTASLSRWERDRGLLRTLVNVGARIEAGRRFPRDEVYEVATDAVMSRVLTGVPCRYSTASLDLHDHARALLAVSGNQSAFSVPITVGDRLWGELWVGRRDQQLVEDQLDAAVSVAGEVATMVAIAERIQRMTRMAFEDALTGVGNRRVLDEALAELLADGGPGATVVLCDIDNLKDLNDSLGHLAGDSAIVATADALAAGASQVPGSVTARVGGDEFVVLLEGEQRATAITLVEAAAHAISTSEHPVEISCGIAVATAGIGAQTALETADAAQYAAKTRGALLVVASDLSDAGSAAAERRRGRRRTHDRRHPAQELTAGVTAVVNDLAELLLDTPESVGGKLRWLGERMLAPLDLQEWSLSKVDLAGPRLLTTDSMGLRRLPMSSTQSYDLQVDAQFRLDTYPATAHAVEHDTWFTISAEDPRADPAERAVLREMAMHHVVALGCRDGDDGWLLELYSKSAALDVVTVGSLLALAASALLHRTFTPLGDLPT
ncbi:sensor domain-containing diguanylate cyclase [Angustibacter luteus]|uniref:Diguanylate cyclase domain-containing protein n=1 Tax=Angustibacter luteus TaxID=658456 RepID=A0ABW1JIT5_9ACTN